MLVSLVYNQAATESSALIQRRDVSMQLQTVSKMLVVVALLLGAGMVTVSTIFVLMGSDAKGDIRDTLLKEKVINSGAPAIPGVLV